MNWGELHEVFDNTIIIQYYASMNDIDPFKNFTPRKNPEPVTAVTDTVSLPTLTQLENMPRAALHSLLQRVCAARWGEIALMDEDASYDAVCLKLLHGGLTQADVWKALPSLKEWMDRRKGKPAQSIALDVSDTRMDRLPIDKLLRLAAMLDEPVIIAPMPSSDG